MSRLCGQDSMRTGLLASPTLPPPPHSDDRHRWRRRWMHSATVARRMLLRHPFVIFAVLILLVTLGPPVAFWATHRWGFVTHPLPSLHHLYGHLHHMRSTRPWMLRWDWTRPLNTTPYDESVFPPPLPPQPFFAWRSPNSPWSTWLKFPIDQLVRAPSPYTLGLPVLTQPQRRPRRRLNETYHPPSSSPPVNLSSCTTADFYRDPHDVTSPALLSLHAFSTARPEDRGVRDMLREYQRRRIPLAYLHLVDFAFVICSPRDDDSAAWSRLQSEQAEWGDLLILDEMSGDADKMVENGDDGKTYRWMREVVERVQDGRGRQALWVMKTDTDSYSIMPNLLDFLLSLDPFEPTYFGSSFGASYRNMHYFQGLGYGVSWNVLETLVAADLPLNLTMGREDHRTGSWMFSLPAAPGAAATAKRFRPVTIEAFSPPSPDALTGLVRVDTYERQGSWYYWWLPQDDKTITAHGMKSRKEYIRCVRYFDSFWYRPFYRFWSSRPSDDRPFMWEPKGALRALRDPMLAGCDAANGEQRHRHADGRTNDDG